MREEKNFSGFQTDIEADRLEKVLAGQLEAHVAEVTAWKLGFCGSSVFIFSKAIKTPFEDWLTRLH